MKDPGLYILKRDPFDGYMRTADPEPPRLWPALIAAFFITALVLSPFLLVRPAHSQTAQCTPPSVSVRDMVQHYSAEITADHKLYAIGAKAQAINLSLAAWSGQSIPKDTPEAVAVVVLVGPEDSVVYVFAADGCSMAHGLVDADVWNQVVADAKAELIEIVKAPPPPKNAPSRNGA